MWDGESVFIFYFVKVIYGLVSCGCVFRFVSAGVLLGSIVGLRG